VAVASAKGGVGKSTVSANLALALARTGHRVGLMDADIYGPSLPLMMGATGEPELTPEGRLLPIVKHDIPIMSMGFLTDKDTPVVWRGPLLAQAVQQFLRQVDWGELDYLIIDLPPGTGDIPLTLSQAIALSGALVVTTPQSVALEDVERGISMFEKVDVDVLGIVENMSYYVCPHCDKRHQIFGSGGARAMAERLGIDLLGEIPLDSGIRQGGDEGHPVALDVESDGGQLFGGIASRLQQSVAEATSAYQ
jgi:ATP-binding protein involved in chromosome partitioning